MYQMDNFNSVHFKFMTIAWIITLALLFLSIPFNKKKYGVFLGYTTLIFKIIDMFFRVYVENYRPISQVLPFHMCNIAVIISGIYLITANKYLFGVIYTWVFGAVLVMFVPSEFTFDTKTYGVLFFLTHTMIIAAVIYGRIYYKTKLSFKTYLFSIFMYILSIINAYYWNERFGTNFFFLHDYVLGFLSNYFSLNVYRVIHISCNILGITVMYNFSKINIKKIIRK